MRTLGKSPYESILGDSIHRTATIMWIQKVLGGIHTKKKNTAVNLMTSERFQLWVVEKNGFKFPNDVRSHRLKSQFYEAHIGNLGKTSHEKAISFVQTQIENAFNKKVSILTAYLEDPQLKRVRANWHFIKTKNASAQKRWKVVKGTHVEGFGPTRSAAQQNAIFRRYFK